jgi:hypothetical protein
MLDTEALLTDAGRIRDTATLRRGYNPTGQMVFRLFGPGDPRCSRAPVLTERVRVSGNGGYRTGPFRPPAEGTYRFTAVLPRDANNNRAARGECNAPGESVTVR